MFRRSKSLAAIFLSVVLVSPASAQSATTTNPATLWPELLQIDAAKAYQAMRQLAAMPGETVSYLRETVPPATKTATDQQIADLIRRLDSDRFGEREKARQELEKLDWQAAPALRKAVQAGGGTLELRRRLEQLITRTEGPLTGTNLRWHRAVEVVESIGTADAKGLLERWAQGAAASRLTDEAKKALKRCDARGQAKLPDKRPTVDAQGDPLPAGAILRLGSTRWRMGRGSIGYERGSIVYTADSKRLIIAGEGAIGVMDAASGKVLMRRAYQGSVSGMKLSPDGRRLLNSVVFYGDNARTFFLHVWDAADLKRVATWIAEGSVEGFADDGKQAVLATEKGIRRIDLASGQEVGFNAFAKDGRENLKAFNGKTVVVSNRRDRLRVFELSSPEKSRNLDMPDREPRSVVLSADGKYLAIGGDYDYGVLIYDLVRGEPIRYLSSKDGTRDTVFGLAFSPDSKTLAFCSSFNKSVLVLWEMEQQRPRWKVEASAGQLIFSPDGKYIAGNGGARTRVWDAVTGKEISGGDEAGMDIQELAFATDGRTLLTVQSGAVKLLDFPGGQTRREFAHPSVYRAALSPDGRRLATSAFNHELRIWDAQTGREVGKLPDRGRQNGFAREFTFTADGRRLLTWEADFRIFIWDIASARLLAEHSPRPEGFPKEAFDDDNSRRRRGFDDKVLHFGRGYCFSKDGSQFLWHFNKLRSYDPATGKLLRTFENELDFGYYRPQMSDDAEWLLFGGGERGVTLFNLRQGKKYDHVQLPHGSHSGAAALSPDGRSFAVAISNRTEQCITLYESATLALRLTIPLEFAYAQALAFSADGRFLAARFSDHSALIWDLRALEL